MGFFSGGGEPSQSEEESIAVFYRQRSFRGCSEEPRGRGGSHNTAEIREAVTVTQSVI